jgi:ribosomal-protein-alanine N-acetyltransferase
MKLTARPLTPAMAEVAAALHTNSGLHEIWDAHGFAELLAMGGVSGCFAMAGEEPAGFVLWRTVADEAEILTICTAPNMRRRGVGKYLLDAAIAAVSGAGAKRLLLEVAVDNAPAIGLYRATGFTEEGRRPGYYRTEAGPVDALILGMGV